MLLLQRLHTCMFDTAAVCVQAKTGVPVQEAPTDPHSASHGLEALDFASVLMVVYQSARLRSPSCTDSAVAALSGCAPSSAVLCTHASTAARHDCICRGDVCHCFVCIMHVHHA